ncbi:tyrosine-type recombinase/integrase [Actinokineospora spheciospongiae]|uniref:tyrosine-type recombinase/integrase n=1 Tax=Actinokineospora spheciospongiae TaxID=909613 RepID=UPI0004B69360|nr:site-specific integrase [Actinokineospora spheciospongiae]
MASTRPSGRQRGNIEERSGGLRVRLYAGEDPVTGKQVYLRETIKGTDKAAWKKANNKLAEFRTQVIKQRSTTSSVKLSYAIDEWLKTAEIESSTRDGYVGYIDRVIKPTLGKTPISKIGVRELESLYALLRRCRKRCDGKPFVEHKQEVDHDCAVVNCKPHECSPMAASTVRQIHSIISVVLGTAVRWEWISSNPALLAQKPRQKPPEPDPPTAAQAARLVDRAFELGDDWGTLVWLVMTTGMRRAELAGLRWSRVDLDAEIIEIRRTFVQSKGVGREKDTKTHQLRRLALDSETVAILRAHKKWYAEQLALVGLEFAEDMFVFMGSRSVDPNVPYPPDAISRRYKRMAAALGIDTHIHALRHFSATELLTAGVDLRTVAGRLGHGGGGATTLRVYAAWVAASDRKAAEILGSRLPKRVRSDSDGKEG